MIEFEDPESKYDFENVKIKNNPKIKIRIATMFAIFLMVILMLAKNDFNFNFMKTSLAQVPQRCDPLYFNDPQNSHADSVRNAEHILKDNTAEFAKIEGFSNAFVIDGEPNGREKEPPVQILLEFNQVTQSKISIPEKLCGFKITAVYR